MHVLFCSAQVTFQGVPPNFGKWEIMNVFGRPGMLAYYPHNKLPMIYVWSSNGLNNGNVTITYENQTVAQNAVTMFNNQRVQGQLVTAALSYHTAFPSTGRSVQRGKTMFCLY